MASSNTAQVTVDPDHFYRTSGALDSVWVKTMPYSKFPTFPKLQNDLETEVLIVGSGISGVSIAYELVRQGAKVTMIEARDILSGETGRTSGHLSSDLDDGYIEIGKKHGKEGAKIAAESHDWALKRVGEISKELGIECEYRMLKGYDISQFVKGTKEHDDDMKEIVQDMEAAREAGLDAHYVQDFAIKGWDGNIDQRDAAVFEQQATFHPTKYVCGVLEWLKKQDNFQAYTRTRAVSIKEKGITVPLVNVHLGAKDTIIETEEGHTIHAAHVVEATCVPLQRLSIIAEMEYDRTYCIAIRIPKGVVEDCLIYDSAEEYKYIRMTECDEKDDYMVVGGCDHAVGQEDAWDERYKELEEWTRKRFTQAGAVDFRWSGQIFEPVDYMGYIGRNSGAQRVYVVTGDSGNGLTHGTIAGKVISDMILGHPNPWEKLYDPRRRKTSIAKSLPSMLEHDIQVNMQYKRFLQTDITDLEDLGLEKGGVLNSKTSKPIAAYKDADGKVHRLSAICPHMKGVVCWNDSEKSWDCPVHGSRFSKDGKQICGPANVNMHPADHNELSTGFMK
ncbi:hypothetical protein H2198_003758 [Neophaeococcomyces mojaviensis]|uniref:Uncharacterized protein n=1 Tax=Neophaeococcomyces mojaviensis TaxID=3383035 RepID=A0ACC3AAE6_9EURO|nr:hypothetical protein H2198_003758 [Knufia sp. JES_112]